MTKIKSILLVTFCMLVSVLIFAQSEKLTAFTPEEDSIFMLKIERLPDVVSVESLKPNMFYKGKYRLMIRQPLDHDQPEKGYFDQRVYILHKGFDKPMVFTTEGYASNYAFYPFYQNELNSIVDGNEIVVEHRYFNESVPDTVSWDYLWVEDAAADHHDIVETFKPLYPNKWISTGISKGGQTALYHYALYPEDVDFSVPYVAPMNYSIEDGRHEPFIEKNGKRKEQKAVRNFQLEVLKRRNSLMPMFKDLVEGKESKSSLNDDANKSDCSEEPKYTFRIPVEEVFDFCVLEYSFAFWQWVADTEKIPGEDASNEEIFKHLIRVSGPEYFSIEGAAATLPFFVQAARELGYYGYDTKPFEDYLLIDDADNYLYNVFLPDSLSGDEFIPETNQFVLDYIENNDPKIILIYGEHDPWSSSGIFFKRKKNMHKFTKKDGHHGTRINNMPGKQREEITEIIETWLKEE